MTREIKFKVFGRGRPNSYGVITPLDTDYEGHKFPENVDFLQFTGLLDAKGKEIYEGDILGDIFEGMYCDWCDACKQIQLRKGWDKECSACSGDISWADVVEDDGKLEVIGNIYENPELLKEAA